MSADGSPPGQDAARPKLWDRMRALADGDHPRAEELRDKAGALEDGSHGYFADPQTVTAASFLGRYARARKLWCECSGEPLI